MVIDLSNMNPSDYAAWWGAIIASLALVWNIVVAIRAGARLHVSIAPNMQFFPAPPGEEDKKGINRGQTTVSRSEIANWHEEVQMAEQKGNPVVAIAGVIGGISVAIVMINKRGRRDYFLTNSAVKKGQSPL